MAINMEVLANDARRLIRTGKATTYWEAAKAVSQNNFEVARRLCSILGARGAAKVAKNRKQRREKKHGQLTFGF